jgi:hypothetical protein
MPPVKDEEGTINVAASKKVTKDKANGVLKLKKPAPKQTKPGNWRDGGVADGTFIISGRDKGDIILTTFRWVRQEGERERESFGSGKRCAVPRTSGQPAR